MSRRTNISRAIPLFQKLYLIDNCNVLAGSAEFACPNKLELCSPISLLKLVWLNALNASALIKKYPEPSEYPEPSAFLKGEGMQRMRLDKRSTKCTSPDHRP